MCVWVCVGVWGPRLVPLITHAYKCPHCQNRTASIPLLFGSKLEQWKWVNSSELHLVSFPSHVCKLFGCMGKRENVPLPASLSEQHCFFCIELSFIFFCDCVYYLHWRSVSTKLFTERKYCQNCAQLVANDLSLLINCMFVYSLLTHKWAKKYRMKTSQHSVKHALNTLIQTLTVSNKNPDKESL